MVRWKISEAISWAVWHLTIAGAIVLLGVWSEGTGLTPSRGIISPAVLAGAFVLVALLLVPAGRSYWFLGTVLTASIAAIFVLYPLLERMRAAPSKPVFWSLAIAALTAAAIPHLKMRTRIVAVGVLILAFGASMLPDYRAGSGVTATTRNFQTALYRVSLQRIEGLVEPPKQSGGAFAILPEGVLLADGDGLFYWIEGDGDIGNRVVSPLSIPSPANRQAHLADFENPSEALNLRLTDVVFRRQDDLAGLLYVAHQYWNSGAKCYTNRVSVIGISWNDGIPREMDGWRTVFETEPCLSGAEPFDDSETGGRLAFDLDGSLLLTVGDLGLAGLDGADPLAQIEPSSYGRIWRIDPDGGSRTEVSKGHRNPQGLVVARDGRIWESEHGPQGGDEINLIRTGGNYGWPYATYGTSYGATSWPLDPEGSNSGKFDLPAISFVPSIATSALIESTGAMFPRWNGDLLVATLRTQAIYRLRLAGDRVVYSERIPFRERLRDIIELPDGSILAWVDSGVLLELRRSAESGVVARSCVGCHAPEFGAAVGPPIDDVLGRKIAGVSGFEYSRALRQIEGRWDRETLARFLDDPDKFAPGTTMMKVDLTKDEINDVLNELEASNQ